MRNRWNELSETETKLEDTQTYFEMKSSELFKVFLRCARLEYGAQRRVTLFPFQATHTLWMAIEILQATVHIQFEFKVPADISIQEQNLYLIETPYP